MLEAPCLALGAPGVQPLVEGSLPKMAGGQKVGSSRLIAPGGLTGAVAATAARGTCPRCRPQPVRSGPALRSERSRKNRAQVHYVTALDQQGVVHLVPWKS